MIIIEHSKIGDIPYLHVVQKGKLEDKLPFIIFVHGFESAKENNLHYAYLLANRGFRVVLPEALNHGERNPGLSEVEMNLQFWDAVTNTIDELAVIKDHFDRENKIDRERIGLAGTSMGGIITLGALTQYPWIKAAVSLMGMPYYEQFAKVQIQQLEKNGLKLPYSEEEKEAVFQHLRKYDLSFQLEKLARRPLLFWHGEKDAVVPHSFSYKFYESIQSIYGEDSEKIMFISDEKAGHKVSTEGVLQLVAWFEKHLLPTMMNVTT